MTASLRFKRDDCLPLPSTIIAHNYQCDKLQGRAVPHGFEYEGEVYKSLAAVAKAITERTATGISSSGSTRTEVPDET